MSFVDCYHKQKVITLSSEVLNAFSPRKSKKPTVGHGPKANTCCTAQIQNGRMPSSLNLVTSFTKCNSVLR